MPVSAILVVLIPIALLLLGFVGFVIYAVVRYAPIVGRIFEAKPVFIPLRVPEEPGGEDVRFPTADGLELAGTYYRCRTKERAGVVVFCHEYLSNRRSFAPYADPLRDRGFDVFTFDFRAHGESDSAPPYEPLQWASDHEVRDVRAALAYLRTRPDRDLAGCLLYGISRGGSAALCASAVEPGVWGVITDGAFPTRGTMWAYMHRWAEIYVGTHKIWQILPMWLYDPILGILGWAARIRSGRRLHCRYPDVERATAKLAPRPLLMIHGAKDAYIGPDIARRLFEQAGEPRELWIVPGAKHNRCREIDPEGYRSRLIGFVGRFGPRSRLPEADPTPAPASVSERDSVPVAG